MTSSTSPKSQRAPAVVTTLTSDGCDRATAYHQANKIIRTADGLYITWLDSDYRCVLAHVSPDGQVRRQWPVAQGFDNHCGAALTQTPDGILHMISGSHAHAFVYRRSPLPVRDDSWSLPIAVGHVATYPSLVHDSAGTLFLSHRHGPLTAGDHWGVRFAYSSNGTYWHSAQTTRMSWPLYTYPTNALVAAPDGTVHILVEWYRTWPAQAGTPAHTLNITVLERGPGGDWRHSDGRPISALPTTFEDSVPIVPAGVDNPRPGNLTLLPDGRPCFGFWGSVQGTMHLAVRDANRQWRVTDLSAAANQVNPGHCFNSQPQIAVNARGQILLVVGRATEPAWGHPSSQLHAFWLDPATAALQDHQAIPKLQPDEPDWLSSLEKPDPGVYPEDFYLIYQTGRRGEGCINKAKCSVSFTHLR